MSLDAYASERHYLDHLLPVWQALRPDERGTLYVTPAVAHSRAALLPDGHAVGMPTRRGHPVLVASFWDSRRVAPRPTILMEHGIGQTYTRPHGAFAGGPQRGNVALFLCPTQRAADLNRARYPRTPSVVVGIPRLDDQWPRRMPERPTVAVAFHWDSDFVPETRSALPHYRAALPGLAADSRWTLLGHGHPRAEKVMRRTWEWVGAEYEPDFGRVLDRSDILVCDNSSIIYEWAATDRPVVVLDAPWYRRNVEHGLRFWSHADVGLRVSGPGELADAVGESIADPARERRRAVVADLFGDLLDGCAARRAADAIRETVTVSRGG